MKNKMLKAGLAVALILGFCSSAGAAVNFYGNRINFNAQGTIDYNYGFEDFGPGFSYPSNPWSTNGVTYTTTDNIIVGTGTFYNPISNVFTYNGWTPVTGTINANHDMFGFDLGFLGTSSTLTLNIFTNLATYIYSDPAPQNASNGLDFWGFTSGPGEYFTGFNIANSIGNGSAPALDNVTLGTTGNTGNPVPEPASMTLMGAGILGLLGFRKKKQ